MSISMNRATILGRLGSEPEVRELREGGRVASLSVATSVQWTDRDSNEKREAVEWHRISVFPEPLIALIQASAHKGSKVFIEGQLHTNKWKDSNGAEKQSTEIVVRNFGGTLILLDAPKQAPEPEQPKTKTAKPRSNGPKVA